MIVFVINIITIFDTIRHVITVNNYRKDRQKERKKKIRKIDNKNNNNNNFETSITSPRRIKLQIPFMTIIN